MRLLIKGLSHSAFRRPFLAEHCADFVKRKRAGRQPLRDHGVGLQWSSGTNSLYTCLDAGLEKAFLVREFLESRRCLPVLVLMLSIYAWNDMPPSKNSNGFK